MLAFAAHRAYCAEAAARLRSIPQRGCRSASEGPAQRAKADTAGKAGENRCGRRMRGLIVVLWRAGVCWLVGERGSVWSSGSVDFGFCEVLSSADKA